MEKKYITSDEVNLRQVAVQYMYDMAKVEWTAGPQMDYSFNNKTLIYQPGEKYVGMVYNNCRNGLEAFKKALDENGKYKLEDVDWNTAPGNSCATSIKHAWQMVSPDVDYQYSIDMMPYYDDTGVAAIGNINWAAYDEKNTTNSILKNTEKKDVLEAYAMTLPGDAFMRYLDTGGHALMVTLEPVVVRDENGEIKPEESFVFLTDQNNVLNKLREYPSSWKVDHKVSFEQSYTDGWLPVTIPELVEGKCPVPEYEAEEAPAAEDLAAGNLKGAVKSNYCIMTVHVEVKKEEEVVACAEAHPYKKAYDLSQLNESLALAELPAGNYSLAVTVTVGLGSKTVAEIAFAK